MSKACGGTKTRRGCVKNMPPRVITRGEGRRLLGGLLTANLDITEQVIFQLVKNERRSVDAYRLISTTKVLYRTEAGFRLRLAVARAFFAELKALVIDGVD